MMKTEFDDLQLGAFVDGELSAAESAAVKQAMLRDPAVRARVEAIRRSSTQLHDAFNVVLDEPVPAKILQTFSSQTPTGGRKRAAVPIALAASLALVIGSLSGFWVGQSNETALQSRAWMASLELDAGGLLDSTPSGAPAAWNTSVGEMELQPILSFRDQTGRICRQYALSNADDAGDHVDGVACRTADGAWQVIAAQLRQKPAPAGGTGFSVATGPAEASVNSLVDALADTPISPAEERDLIRVGWQ